MLLDRSLRPTENCKFRFSRQDSLEKQSTSCLLVGGEERWLSQARGHLIKKEHAMQFFGEAIKFEESNVRHLQNSNSEYGESSTNGG